MGHFNSLTRTALLAACALTAHVIETRLPPPFLALPYVRLGVANIFVLIALYNGGFLPALGVLAVKCTLGPLLAGAPVGVLYSLAGGACCLPLMLLCRRCKFGMAGVSMAGAVGNQAGQTLLAAAMYSTAGILTMLPATAAMAAVCGFAMGLAVRAMLARIPKKYQ